MKSLNMKTYALDHLFPPRILFDDRWNLVPSTGELMTPHHEYSWVLRVTHKADLP